MNNKTTRKLLYISLIINVLCLTIGIFAVVKIGSPRHIFTLIKYRGNGVINLKNSRTSHLKTLPISADRIVMLGNSITAECEWRELLNDERIINRGVIADGTADILARLADITAMRPRQIFLLIGVNDLLFVPLSKIVENYENIVVRVRHETPHTALFLESILPIHNDLRRNGMKNGDIEALNWQIESLAKKHGATFIDLHSKFADTDGALKKELTFDGIHLNGDGYLLMKDILLPFISN